MSERVEAIWAKHFSRKATRLQSQRDKARQEKREAINRVIDLFNKQGGWIPGAAYGQLAEALGVDADRLIHWEGGTHHYPEGTGPGVHP